MHFMRVTNVPWQGRTASNPKIRSALFAALPSIPEVVSISPQGLTCIGGEFSSNRHVSVKIMSNLPLFAQLLTVLNVPAIAARV